MEQLIFLIKKFGWRIDGKYTILDLGTMPNAIVVKREEVGHLYCISLRGYFSFPNDYYNVRFKTKNEAIDCACKYMTRWIEELNNHLVNNNKNN
jgi:hypothetical protein